MEKLMSLLRFKRKKPFKVQYRDSSYGMVAESLTDLETECKKKFNVESITFVLEEDGTVVDNARYFESLADHTILKLVDSNFAAQNGENAPFKERVEKATEVKEHDISDQTELAVQISAFTGIKNGAVEFVKEVKNVILCKSRIEREIEDCKKLMPGNIHVMCRINRDLCKPLFKQFMTDYLPLGTLTWLTEGAVITEECKPCIVLGLHTSRAYEDIQNSMESLTVTGTKVLFVAMQSCEKSITPNKLLRYRSWDEEFIDSFTDIVFSDSSGNCYVCQVNLFAVKDILKFCYENQLKHRFHDQDLSNANIPNSENLSSATSNDTEYADAQTSLLHSNKQVVHAEVNKSTQKLVMSTHV